MSKAGCKQIVNTLALVFASVVALAAGQSPVTFNRDVAPILQKHCQNCHRPGQAAPMSLLTYEEARPWAKAIRNAVATRKMPPWFADPRYGHFSNDPSLPQAEIDKLVRWANDGELEGNAEDLPLVQWPKEAWQIQPDVVVSLPTCHVPAKGIIEWVYATVPSGFARNTWVTSIEVLPGDPSVLHHAGVFVKAHQDRDVLGAMTAVYVPGFRAMDFRVHRAAQLIPANSDLVVQLHYTPNGKEVTDVTRIGFTSRRTHPRGGSSRIRPSRRRSRTRRFFASRRATRTGKAPRWTACSTWTRNLSGSFPTCTYAAKT